MTFKRFEDILQFRKQFDGHIFKGTNGMRYPAMVELSSLQRISNRRKKSPKKDPKMNTFERDPNYIEFMKFLENSTNEKSTFLV